MKPHWPPPSAPPSNSARPAEPRRSNTRPLTANGAPRRPPATIDRIPTSRTVRDLAGSPSRSSIGNLGAQPDKEGPALPGQSQGARDRRTDDATVFNEPAQNRARKRTGEMRHALRPVVAEPQVLSARRIEIDPLGPAPGEAFCRHVAGSIADGHEIATDQRVAHGNPELSRQMAVAAPRLSQRGGKPRAPAIDLVGFRGE